MSDPRRLGLGDLGWLAGSPRSAIRLRNLVPVFLLTLAGAALVQSASGPAQTAGALLACVGLVWVALAWIAAYVAGSEDPTRRFGLGRQVRLTVGAMGISLVVLLIWGAPFAFLVFAGVFGFLLFLVPGFGEEIFTIWNRTVAVVAYIAASAVALAALPAAGLAVPCGAIERPDSVEAFTTTLHYVRTRAGTGLLCVAAALGGTLAALAPFALVVYASASAVWAGEAWIETGRVPTPSTWVADFITGRSGVGDAIASGVLAKEGALAALAVVAFVVSSLAVGVARSYLVVRRIADGHPLGFRRDPSPAPRPAGGDGEADRESAGGAAVAREGDGGVATPAVPRTAPEKEAPLEG